MDELNELFMAETMTTQVEEFADQAEHTSFLEVYEAGEQIRPMGNKFTYDEVTYSRGMAPVTGTQSPSKQHKPLNVKLRAGHVYAIKEHVDLPAEILMMARGTGQSDVDPQGWLNKNLKELTNRVQRTRNYWAAQSLHAASVDLGAFPNADLPTGTTLTYPVATLSSVGAWSAAGTKIRSAEINPLIRTYRRNTGYRPGCAYASDVIEGYITQNTELANPVDYSPSLAQRKIEANYLEGGTIMRLGGLDFKFVRDDYVTDANQETADNSDSAQPTVTDVITDTDLMPVLPPRSRWEEAFAQVEGRVFIPTGAITSAAVGNPLSLIAEARGWAAYLELLTNPVGLRLHVVWHGSFVQKQRLAVMVYNTTP